MAFQFKKKKKSFLLVAAKNVLPPMTVEVNVAQLLGMWGLWGHQAFRNMDCLCHRSYGPIRVFFFFWVSCSWRSEGLFGQSSPIQALKGLPCLGSFSVVRQVKHIEGLPGWGPTLKIHASGVWWAKLSSIQLLMLACGEREAMVMAPPPTHDSAVSLCFHSCLAFLHWHFPPWSPPSHPLNLSLHSQQQPSPWDHSTIP